MGNDSQIHESEVRAEQGFVDTAYAQLDHARQDYRERQRRAHSTHGVGNAQGWSERDVIASHFGEMAARLDNVEDRLVFGRLDMDDAERRYIGRVSLSDTDGEPLLIDWRAPAAAPFYRATAVEPLHVARRRHITTHSREVVALEDELLDASAAAESGLELQGEGALMSALGKARDGRMGDIVATIQSEQDVIIRSDSDGLVVVQGGPGTGKTAVALHRAAYLLHAQRERLERSGVLLVGPSRVFLRYIEKVLPSLGETGVVSITLGDLVPGIRGVDIEDPVVARIKGLPAWSKILERAVRDIVKVPATDISLQVWNRRVTLFREDISQAIRHARRTGRPHNVARDTFALDVMDVLAKRLIHEAGDAAPDGSVDSDDLTAWTAEVRDSLDARRAINTAWMPTSAQRLLERLWAKPALLARINSECGSPLRTEELRLLQRERGSALTISDVVLLDELEELLGTTAALEGHNARQRNLERQEEVARAREAMGAMNLGGGIVTAEMLAESVAPEDDALSVAERAAADRSWTYGHIVVDEAQDVSPMAWKALLRRCPSRSFTVVGDLDQKRGTGAAGRPQTWEKALGPASRALSAEYVLSVSYRTPRALTLLAEDVLARAGSPVIHPMTAVRDVPGCYAVVSVPIDEGGDQTLYEAAQQAANRACVRLDEESGHGTGRVAILVGVERARRWNADMTGSSTLNSRVSVLSVVAAKGLEFDSVVLVEPSEVLADGPGDLFVALTRATHDLQVVHAMPLPRGMEEWDEE